MIASRRSVARPTSTRERVLEGALRSAVHGGTSALSLQSIASTARVSKALLLYHFRDKDDLIAALITWLTDRIVHREEEALRTTQPHTSLETLWMWLEQEITRGELRVLLELGSERGERTRAALRESGTRRHAAAEATMQRVFQLLRLTPRVPASMLAAAELAVREGIVLDIARDGDRIARAAFDVFWLGALRLAQ